MHLWAANLLLASADSKNQQPIPRPDGPLQFSSDHYRSLYTCFSLFVVLYMAEPGYESAPVGDELMEWLNIHFIEPSTEEGDHLSSLERPWEDETFWPYLTRSVWGAVSVTMVLKIYLQSYSTWPIKSFTLLPGCSIPTSFRRSPRINPHLGTSDWLSAATSEFQCRKGFCLRLPTLEW